jgi:hypothetical protein
MHYPTVSRSLSALGLIDFGIVIVVTISDPSR